MLYCLAICCGDLLDIGGFLLPRPSQLYSLSSVHPQPAHDLPVEMPYTGPYLIGHCLFLGHNDVFLAQCLLQPFWTQDPMT